eukprot:TRINITY_DN3035_c0_g1_i1.p1 TRINITY_DN3035_c0_g1~~TRINITY_DN3035_c0_g1_i1.p1  ORF type:complete len:132 (-),score=73.81 TRINITY_DN3035_c0_g1_i1:229-603(-)
MEPILATACKTFGESRLRSLKLFRSLLRQVPFFIGKYELESHPKEMRLRIRQEFEKFRDLDDLSQVNALLFKGELELEEAVKIWKQKSHLCDFFGHGGTVISKEEEFMQEFCEGGTIPDDKYPL